MHLPQPHAISYSHTHAHTIKHTGPIYVTKIERSLHTFNIYEGKKSEVVSTARRSSRGVWCVWHLYVERLNGRDGVGWRVHLRPRCLGPLPGSWRWCLSLRPGRWGGTSGFLNVSSHTSARLWKGSDISYSASGIWIRQNTQPWHVHDKKWVLADGWKNGNRRCRGG